MINVSSSSTVLELKRLLAAEISADLKIEVYMFLMVLSWFPKCFQNIFRIWSWSTWATSCLTSHSSHIGCNLPILRAAAQTCYPPTSIAAQTGMEKTFLCTLLLVQICFTSNLTLTSTTWRKCPHTHFTLLTHLQARALWTMTVFSSEGVPRMLLMSSNRYWLKLITFQRSKSLDIVPSGPASRALQHLPLPLLAVIQPVWWDIWPWPEKDIGYAWWYCSSTCT